MDPGAESSSVTLLKRAVELDHARRFTEALVCYTEGINLLMNELKGVCVCVCVCVSLCVSVCV